MGAGASFGFGVASAIFGAGVVVGAALEGNKPTNAPHALLDALDAVDRAAEVVMEYLRAAKDAVCSAAAWALDKIKKAAAALVDKVVALLRRLRGRKPAAAARREMDRAAQHAVPDVYFSEAAARVARSGRCIMDAPAAAWSVAVVPYAAARPGGAGAGSASVVARRAVGSAVEMIEAFVAEAGLGDNIPAAARSSITV